MTLSDEWQLDIFGHILVGKFVITAQNKDAITKHVAQNLFSKSSVLRTMLLMPQCACVNMSVHFLSATPMDVVHSVNQ